MELLAVIEALKKIEEPSNIVVISDSSYVVNSVKKGWLLAWEKFGWKRKDRTDTINKDLWIECLSLIRKHKKVEFSWVRGHNGHKENERCDELANLAIINAKN